MGEASTYHGHAIHLDLRELKSGGFECTYFIDARYCFQSLTNAFAVTEARADAMARAHGSIDALDALTLAQRVPAGRPSPDADLVA